jgi:hypothetical protein
MYCTNCGGQIGEGAFCPNCGSPAGGAAPATGARLRDDGKPADPAGTGRYILSFLLAGLIGLGIQYWTRDYGWRGVIINAVISAVVMALIILSVGMSLGGEGGMTCQDEFGRPC